MHITAYIVIVAPLLYFCQLQFIKLDKLKPSIREYQIRIDLTKSNSISGGTLKDIEKEVSEQFSDERLHIENHNEETNEFSDEYREFFRKEKPEPGLEVEVQKELKKLYRKLARKFHSDLAN